MFIHQVIDENNSKVNKKHRETSVCTQPENKDQKYRKKKGKGGYKAHDRIPVHTVFDFLRINGSNQKSTDDFTTYNINESCLFIVPYMKCLYKNSVKPWTLLVFIRKTGIVIFVLSFCDDTIGMFNNHP